jgi:hypothetical protein
MLKLQMYLLLLEVVLGAPVAMLLHKYWLQWHCIAQHQQSSWQ